MTDNQGELAKPISLPESNQFPNKSEQNNLLADIEPESWLERVLQQGHVPRRIDPVDCGSSPESVKRLGSLGDSEFHIYTPDCDPGIDPNFGKPLIIPT